MSNYYLTIEHDSSFRPSNFSENYFNEREEFPNEIILTIFSHLPYVRDLGRLGQVCKKWYQIQLMPEFWAIAIQRFQIRLNPNVPKETKPSFWQRTATKVKTTFSPKIPRKRKENEQIIPLKEYLYVQNSLIGALDRLKKNELENSDSLISNQKIKYIQTPNEYIHDFLQIFQAIYPLAAPLHKKRLETEYLKAVENIEKIEVLKTHLNLIYSAAELCELIAQEAEIKFPANTPLTIKEMDPALSRIIETNSKQVELSYCIHAFATIAFFAGKSVNFEFPNEKMNIGSFAFAENQFTATFDQPVTLKTEATLVTHSLEDVLQKMVNHKIYKFKIQPNYKFTINDFPREYAKKMDFEVMNRLEIIKAFFAAKAPQGFKVDISLTEAFIIRYFCPSSRANFCLELTSPTGLEVTLTPIYSI